MRSGFTLLEVLIAIALLGVLASFVIPVGVQFYQTETLTDTAENVANTLRRARLQAFTQKHDASFGVKILSTGFTLFEGISYANRSASEDEAFNFPVGVTASGTDEITFLKFSGEPSVTGTVTLNLGGASRSITVAPQGVIY